MNNLLIAISILIISCNSTLQNDTLFFDRSENLIVITQNTDKIRNYPPFSHTQGSFAAKIIADSVCNLYLTVKDINKNDLKTFCWIKLPPGVYKFSWWEYISNLSSGVYFIETRINGKSQTQKSIFVK